MSIKRQFYLLAIICIVLALSAKFYTLFVMHPHWDDSYYLNIAINYMDNGLLTPRMWRLDADSNIIAGSGTGYGIFLPILWYQTVGLSLLSGRIMMYLVALLILPVIYLTARLWWGHLAGIVAMVVTAISTMFFSNYNLRMDAFGELAYSLVLLLHIYAIRSKRHYLHFFVGVAAILTAELHILGVIYLFALAFYYAVDQIQHIVSLRRFQLKPETVFYMTGALLAGLAYIAVHVLPNTEAYFIIAKMCEYCDGRSIHNELLRIAQLALNMPVASLFFIFALYGMARRSNPSRKHYLLVAFGTILMMIVVNPPAQFQYLAHLLPIISIGIGGFFHLYCYDEKRLSQKSIYLLSFSAVLMLIQLGFVIPWNVNSAESEGEEYGARVSAEAIAYIREHIPYDTVIVGPPFAYVDLIEYHNFMTIADGDMYGVHLRGESFDAYLKREAPQVIITEPYPFPQNHQDAIDALVRYYQSQEWVEVLPDLLVAPELLE